MTQAALATNHSTGLYSPVARGAAEPPDRRPGLKFGEGEGFLRELRRRVDAYFDRTGHRRRDCPAMYAKSAVVLAAAAATYVLLVFVATSWWAVLPLAGLMGLCVALIGFNVQHDGGHKAYSDRPWVNKVMARTLDLVGGSSYLWDLKHNAIHHTYTNIDGYDEDIDVGVFGRLSPHQRRLPFHRLQHLYMWLLYGFMALKWQVFDDFRSLASGRQGGHRVARPRGKDLLVFVCGKVVFLSLAFGIPMIMHPAWAVLGVYFLSAFVSGAVMAVVFQLAHCVGEAGFPAPVRSGDGRAAMEAEWAVHQVSTTVDFARGSRVLSWLLGGLNFQIEHHLFSRICHVHYPALSQVVQQTCREFGVAYSAHDTFGSAVASHFRWLAAMGRAPSPLPVID